MRGAQTEYGATHRDQPPELELEADQEQQHDHAQLGDRDDALGRSKGGQSGRADDDAGNEIGDNGRQPDSAGNGHAQDRGGEQHQPECQEAKFAVLLIHVGVRDEGWACAATQMASGHGCGKCRTALACTRRLL